MSSGTPEARTGARTREPTEAEEQVMRSPHYLAACCAILVPPSDGLCVASAECSLPPAYVITYEWGESEPAAVCAEHCAELSANDPLGYILSVRSLRLEAIR